MKLLFAHDHIFYKYNNEYYSNGSFPKHVLLRYTDVFDEVKFISRQESVHQQIQKMSLSTTEHVKFIKVPNFKSINKFYKILEARKIIEKEVADADCVIARSSSIGSIAIEYAIKKNKPYAIEVVGCPWDALWNYGNLAGKILAPLSCLKLKKIVKSAPYVLYVTNKFLQKRYPTNGTNISCSNVKIEFIDEQVLINRIDKIHKLKTSNKIILGTAAAIDVKFKGQEYVIEAISKLAKEGYDFEYQLAGNGDDSYLKSIAEKFGVIDKIVFLGAVPQNKIVQWIDNIDIYIQPSKQEGLPRAVIESMSRACPIIASNAGGIPELVEEKHIFKKGNCNELSTKINSLLSDKEEMKNQAIRNFNKSRDYYHEKLDMRRNDFLNEFKTYSMDVNKKYVDKLMDN
ncbi:glycosyltransferase family 4 protein [Chengkuizengella sediminis]|uniref:glycosyltransferase family 4 protein n=1 Tax=Chengkuizengella sediminis TaxID=1885917 RepID=UPI001389C809|nr:glycosyltransferase family 4 protein [Chengkuizengella sediminis]NDI34869.1 glycosyltransferase family 4 protein [Chengkuizengella sediminis]